MTSPPCLPTIVELGETDRALHTFASWSEVCRWQDALFTASETWKPGTRDSIAVDCTAADEELPCLETAGLWRHGVEILRVALGATQRVSS